MTMRQWIRTFSTCCELLGKKKSASSNRWLQRQGQDIFTREAKLRNYASRAAFKLLELNKQYHLLKPGMTVVDLGFAPGSWTQIAVEQTKPNGSVIGVDVLHASPPPGASAIQGNFLSKEVQDQLKIELNGKPVDTVLSDMLVPWPQTAGFWHRSINDPYIRMANTTGMVVRDHGASIDLCDAALLFAIDELKPGGSFVCKFYSGSEDDELEKRLGKVFKQVKRSKPEASRKASREMYFIGLNKIDGVQKEDIWDMF